MTLPEYPPISPATVRTLTPTRLYGPHDTFLTAVAYSADGTLLVTGDIQGYVMVWDIATGHRLDRRRLFSVAVASLALRGDAATGFTLAAIAIQDTIKTLRISSDGKLIEQHHHVQPDFTLLDVTFSSDGRPLIACVASEAEVDTRLYLIYGDENEMAAVFRSGNDTNPNAAFNRDGTLVAVGHDDGTVSIRGARRGAGTVAKIETGFLGVKQVSFSPDSGRVAVIEDRGDRVAAYEVRSGQRVGEPFEMQLGNEAQFSHDGALLAVSTTRKGGSLYFYDVAAGTPVRSIKASSPLAFSATGEAFVAGNSYAVYSKSILLWDPGTPPEGILSRVNASVDAVSAEAYLVRQLAVLREHVKPVLALAFSPDNRTLASGGADQEIYLWNMETGGENALLTDHRAEVTALAFSPDGAWMASASGFYSGTDDNNVHLWDADDGVEVAVFEAHKTRVVAVAYGLRGERIVSAETMGTVLVWDANTRNIIRRIDTPSVINHMALSPSGALIATAHGSETALEDTKLRLWNTETGELLQEIDEMNDWLLRLAFSPDGNVIMAADYAGRVCGWDVHSGALVKDFNGGVDMQYNPQGDLIAVMQDKTVNLIAAEGGRTLMPLRHGEDVTALAFSGEGDMLAVGTADGAVVVWGVEDSSSELADTATLEQRRVEAARSGRHTLQLISITCKVAQERDGDETFIRLDGQTMWAVEHLGRKMHHQPSRPREISTFDFKQCRMLGRTGWQHVTEYTPSDFRLGGLTGPIELELWEEDNFLRGGDDYLGKIVVSPAQAGQGEQQSVIYSDGTQYIITYEVLID